MTLIFEPEMSECLGSGELCVWFAQADSVLELLTVHKSLISIRNSNK